MKIVILGGGSAGWMTAAALSTLLPKRDYRISLVESKAIGTVSVGEATIPGILEFNQLLGIDEKAFLKHTQGSFKLGIVFKDWNKIGQQYMHPFGQYGVNMDGIPFHHYWLKDRIKEVYCDPSQHAPLSNYAIEYLAAKHNKFSHPQKQSRSPLAQINYAYHFDATQYASFLQKLACGKGVQHIVDEFISVSKHPSGDIACLNLAKSTKVEGDLFIDCSGFKALLIDKALAVGFEDWRDYLPCDSAIAQASESLSELKPYTIASAHENGWQWQIPLQHRVGNGFVYSSRFLDEKSAIDKLAQRLPSKALQEPRKLSWINGKRKQVFKKNVLAIGLSAGFIEPLESTGLQLIQSSILKLLSLLPRVPIASSLRKSFNQYMNQEIDGIRDFVLLHYVANQRKDSEFWRYCKGIKPPDSLLQKIELYRETGCVFRENNELFNEISWFSVLNGQGIKANTYHPLADKLDDKLRQKHMNTISGAMNESLANMLDHKEYLDAYLR